MSRRFGHSASLFAIALLCSFSLPAIAQEDGRLRARVDAGAKLGTERSLGSVEAWVPLDQGNDRVLYGDIRFMMDDADNAEGNLGVGYRQIVTDMPFAGRVIAGGHAWLDGRRTDLGSNFKQVTLGGELLGEDWDVRANAYVPLSNEKTHLTDNTGSATPYLAGGGIFYDTQGRLLEEPQPGLDLELGYRLPVLEDHVESVRVYGGLYHFEGDRTEDVSGWRTRLVAEISPAISVGARFQKDDERGSQGFLEATVRFPFDAKKSFRKEGLRARLDESPERDVDIVSGSKVTDTGAAKPVLNANSGEVQRVLHVDNTAAPGGDGTKERPFNALKLAEAALLANDVIYLHAGNGTTSGQNLGIVIDKPNVSLIGSGTDFIFDNGKFIAGRNLTGTVIAPKTTAPVITNTHYDAAVFHSGSAVAVLNDNALIAGVSVENAVTHGIIAAALGGAQWNRFTIQNIEGSDNGHQTVSVVSRGSSVISSVILSNILAEDNDRIGLYITSDVNSNIGSIVGTNLHLSANSLGAMRIQTLSNGTIGSVSLDGVEAKNNIGPGIHILADSGNIGDVSLTNSTATSNGGYGFFALASNGGSINSLYSENTAAIGNAQDGFIAQAQNGGTINKVEARSVIATNNNAYGVYVHSIGTNSTIGQTILDQIQVKGSRYRGVHVRAADGGKFLTVEANKISSVENQQEGFLIYALNGSSIGNLIVEDVVTANNTHDGFSLVSSGSVINGATLRGINSTGNTQRGILVYGLSAGILDNVSLKNSKTSGNNSGVFLNDDSAGTFNVDISGGNSLYGNTIEDLRLDLDGGSVNAQGNWWGQAGGPLAGRVVSENNAACPGSCGTANTSGALTSAP